MINLCDVLQSPESVRDMKQQHSQRTYRNVFNVNVKDVPIKKEFKLPNQHIHRNILTSMHSIEGGLATVDATRKGDNVGAQGGAHVRDSGLLPVLALAIAKEKGQGTWSSCLVDRPPLTVTRAFSALITSMSPSSSSSGCARSFVTSGWSSFLPSKLYRPMHPIASHLVADIHGPSGSQMLLTVRSETKNIRGTYLRHPQRLLLWLFFFSWILFWLLEGACSVYTDWTSLLDGFEIQANFKKRNNEVSCPWPSPLNKWVLSFSLYIYSIFYNRRQKHVH